jgi:hypothetical protein
MVRTMYGEREVIIEAPARHDLGNSRLGSQRCNRERGWSRVIAHQDRDLVINNELYRDALCLIRHRAVVADDELRKCAACA